jgi:hypothetical protein
MHKPCYSEAFLSLFTSPDRAVAIVGDLREEAPRRGPWRALKLLGVALALAWERIRSAPLRCLALVLLGFVAYTIVWNILFVASGLPWYPWNRINEPAFWARLALVFLVANLLTGFILGRWVSIGGTNAVAPIVFVWLTVWPVELILAKLLLGRPVIELVLLAFAFALCGLLPLIAGGTLARRRASA